MKTQDYTPFFLAVIAFLATFCTVLIISNAYNLHRIQDLQEKVEVLKGE